MSPRLWIRVVLVIVIVGGVAALLAYGFSRDVRYIHSPLIAKQAPGFSLILFDGKTITLEDLRGKVVLLNFWASWCVPCRAEAQSLEEAWKQYKDRGIVFVGVNIQDQEDKARAFMEEFGISYPNGRDSAGKIAIDYGVWGIPETFVIDRQGRITYKHAGAMAKPLITVKLEQALLGIVTAEEGKAESQSIR
jgi:cytochrome c biogenesis protein CcmG/thiol:disulfide interchange protein DsbE